MRKIALGLALVASVLAVAACASAPPVRYAAPVTLAVSGAPQLGKADAKPDTRLAAPVNDFGFGLLRQLGKTDAASKATVISPLSLHAVLSMVANGASGSTLAEMRRVLGESSLSEADANAAYANEIARLQSSQEPTVAIANSLWLDNQLTVSQPFVKTTQQYFGAEVRTLHLASDAARDAINQWGDSATHRKIPEVLGQVPDPSARLVAVNATYFKGDWDSPFEVRGTDAQPFASPNGTTTVSMMHQTESWHYADTADYQAIRLPYQGETTSMLVVLPRPSSSLESLVSTLTAEKFSAIEGSLQPQEVDLSLPKLETQWGSTLNDQLAALGMPKALEAGAADFSRMEAPGGTEQLYLSEVLQKTYLRVDEKGTEAAALSVATMASGSAMPRRPIEMNVDRPYLMAIVDNPTGTILFLAAVHDPAR